MAIQPVLEALEGRQLLAAGDLDPTFGTGGVVLTTSEGPGFSELHDSVVLSNGKVVAVGITGNDFMVARYDASGKLDPTFGGAGYVRTDFGHTETAAAVAVQADGKIVVAGERNGAWPDRQIALARYNTDGALDTTFGGTGKILTPSGTHATDVAIAPGGKIVVTGGVRRPDGNNDPVKFNVWRYNADGSLDTTFDGDGQATASGGGTTFQDHLAQQLAVQSDGKVLVVGRAWNPTVENRLAIARFKVDGNPDAAFDGDGVLITDINPYSTYPLAISTAPGGKIVVATGGSGVTVARYNGDGSIDTTFDRDGKFLWSEGPDWFVNYYGALAVHADGKILVGVGTNNNTGRDISVARINSTGGLDSSFGTGGEATFDIASGSTLVEIPYAIGFHPADGSVIVGATTGTFFSSGNNYADFALVKLYDDGVPDLAYGGTSNLPAPLQDYGRHVAIQPDGKTLVAGVSEIGFNRGWTIARHLPDGSIDPTFGTRGVVVIDLADRDLSLKAIRVQNDGRIILVGTKGYFSDSVVVARLNPDGTRDGSLDGDGLLVTESLRGGVASVLPQADGKLVLVGQIYDTVSKVFVAAVRLNADGTRDATFSPVPLGLPVGASVSTVLVQPDGKILLAGQNAVLRFNPDWTRDAAFDGDGLLATSTYVGDLALDTAGRIVLLESRYSNNVTTHSLTRLRPDGTPDATFGTAGTFVLDPTTQVENFLSIATDAHDRILVTGNLVEEYDRTRLITLRVRADGTVDPHFGSNGFVTAFPQSNYPSALSGAADVVATADGKLLVLGFAWNQSNGTRDFALLRYAGTTPLLSRPGGTYEVIEGGSITLIGSATSNLPITKYEWDLNNDGTFETATAAAVFSAANIDGPAQRVIPFRVTDASGQTSTQHATINIKNAPPAITLSGPARADAGVPYPLSLTYTDPATAAGLTDTIKSVTIDWGDDDVTTYNGAPGVLTHVYPNGRANYRINVIVTDEDGVYTAEHSVNGDGILDVTFGKGTGTLVARGAGGELFPLPDGTFIHAAGNTLTRYFSDGTQDMRFANVNIPAALTPAAFAITPDGKVLVVGTEFASTAPNARGRMFVARYTVAGGLDTSLGGDGVVHFDLSGLGLDLGTAIAALPDGRILVAGSTALDATYVPTTTRAVLLRLNPDGTPDASYGQAGRVTTNYYVVPSHLAVAPSGRTYLGFMAQSYTITALNPDGSPDAAFGNNGNIFDGSYSQNGTLTLDRDGNLLVTGMGWSSGNLLKRYTSAGKIDTTFGDNGEVRIEIPGYYSPEYTDVALDAAGGILLYGTAYERTDLPNTTITDLIVSRVVDGALDLSYGDAGSILLDVRGDGSNDTAHSFVVLPTGKLLATASNTAAGATTATPLILRLGESRHPVSANNTGPSISVSDLTLSPAAPKEVEVFTLNGKLTDPDAADAHTVTIEWGDGTPNTVLSLPAGQLTFAATHSYPEDSAGGLPTAWPVKVTVSDGLLTADVRRTITVANAAPTANAGPDKAAKENELVQLTGAGTDPSAEDSQWLAYHWKVTGPKLGVNGTQLDFHTKDISFVPGQVGTYTATLTVTDPDGGTHSDSTTITVTDSVPEIRITYDTPFEEGDAIQINSWYNGDIVSRKWTVTDPGGVVVLNSTNGSITFTAPDEGNYTVLIEYADDEGNTNSSVIDVPVINVAPRLPSFDNPINGKEGVPVKLTLTATDPGTSDTLTYLWEILDGQSKVLASSNTDTIQATLPSGTHLARLTVTDNDGGIVIRQAPVNIADVAPKLHISGPASVPEGSPYTLTLAATDPGNDTITSWTINWGDGTPVQTFNGNPSTVTHTYPDGPKTHQITATATDEHGSYTVGTLATTNPLDTTFGTNGIATTQMSGAHDRVTGLVVQPDGKVIAVGSAGNPIRTGVVRYNFNGSRDTSFFSAGTITNTFSDADVALLPDGTVVVAASSSSGGIAVVRLNPNTGSILSRTEVGMQAATINPGQIQIQTLPDGRFYVAGRGGGDGIVANPEGFYPSSILLMPDGRILAAQGGRLAVYNADGSQDMTFGTNGFRAVEGSNQAIVSILRDEAGRFILTTLRHEVLRLNSDFTTDTTFGTDGRASVALGASYSQTTTAALTPTGDVVIGGATGTANVDTNYWVARFLMGMSPVKVTDVAPTITLTGNPTVADGAAYTLNLAATDPGTDTITSWLINWGDGTPVQTVSGSLSSVTHTFADGPGGYAVTASAVDEDGAHGSARLNVTVTPATAPFVFGNSNISLDKTVIDEDGTVTLTGSFTDTRGVHDVTIDWGDGSAPSTVSLPRGTFNFSFTHRYLDDPAGEEKSYVLTAVAHSASESRTATTNVTVNNTNPVAAAGPDRTVTEGTLLTFTGEGTDRGTLDVLTYHWEVLAPAGLTFPAGTGKTYSFTPPDAGQYRVRLTVRDDDGGAHTDTVFLTVTETRPTLTAHAAATSVNEGGTLTLALSASDPGAGDAITQWTIDWGDGSPVQTLPGDATSASHVYPEGPRNVALSVRATDDDGTYDVPVTGLPPAGVLDPAFGGASGTGKITVTMPGYTDGRADDIVLQPDGKAVVVGRVYYNTNGSDQDGVITRFKPDGLIDASFGNAGNVFLDLGPGLVDLHAVALDANGRILVGGGYYASAGNPVAFLARYNPDGTPDLSFGPDGTGRFFHPTAGAADVHKLVPLPDGTILAALSHSPGGGGGGALAVSKFKPDGTLDAAFGSNGTAFARVGTATDTTTDMAVAADGKIILVGTANNGGTSSGTVVRFNADGTPDTSFDGDGKLAVAWGSQFTSAETVHVLPDGRILVGGYFMVPTPGPTEFHMVAARYNVNGSIDRTFGVNGTATLPDTAPFFTPADMSVDAAGRILLAGDGVTGNNGTVATLVRLTPDGRPDPLFGPAASPGIATVTFAFFGDQARALATDADGRIWLAGITGPTGPAGSRSIALARFLPGDLRVNNIAPTITLAGSTPTGVFTVGLGTPVARNGSFTDPGLTDSWTATVNYGDQTPTQPLTLNPDKTFSLNHNYAAPGRYFVTVRITDDDGGVGTATFMVDVRDATIRGNQTNDTFDVRLSEDGQRVEFFENAPLTGAPTFTLPLASAGTIKIDRGFGTDRLTIHSGNFILQPVAMGAVPNLANFEIIMKGAASATLFGNQQLRALQVLDDATFAMETGPARTLRVGRLTIGPSGRLDVANGTLIVALPDKPYATALAEVFPTLDALVRSARNTGPALWTGPGINSSAARTNPLTGLATVATSPQQWWVTVKHTFNGDATLDGRVNSDDYFRIDSGFLAQPADPTYAQGDFNYDDRINSDDYFLIDSAFLGQPAPAATGSGDSSPLASTPTAATAARATAARATAARATAARATAATPDTTPTKKRRPTRRPLFSDLPIPHPR